MVGELTLFVRGHEVLNIKPLALSWEPLEKRYGPGFQGRRQATGPEVWRRLREIISSEDTGTINPLGGPGSP